MANYCYVVPIVPGGEDLMRKWVREGVMNNPDHDRFLKDAGVTREQVWIQRTPMGDFGVASFEVSSPKETFEKLSRSNDPWAVKFRDFLKQAHGLDFSQPTPINEQLIDWHAAEKVGP